MKFQPHGHGADSVLPEHVAAPFCGINSSTWRRMLKNGETPTPIQLSPRRRGYRLREIQAWMKSRQGDPMNPDDLMGSIIQPFGKRLGDLTFAEVEIAGRHYKKLAAESQRAAEFLERELRSGVKRYSAQVFTGVSSCGF